jgi:hypothetical protein
MWRLWNIRISASLSGMLVARTRYVDFIKRFFILLPILFLCKELFCVQIDSDFLSISHF